MDSRNCYLLCLALVLAVSSTIEVEGLDITKMLSQYPECTLFNKYLTETKLAEQINSLKAVTVMAVNDEAMAAIVGKSPDTVKAIMSTHVLVNYYDEKRLSEAQGAHAMVETMFQRSGVAKNSQGYIYVALINEGETAFGSAAAEPNPTYDVLLVKTMMTEPEVVSILMVNKLLVPAGIEGASPTWRNAFFSTIAQSPGSAEAPAPSTSSHIHVSFVIVGGSKGASEIRLASSKVKRMYFRG
ncbi:Fasciclin-like arabinogalactan protein 14, partial [Mucuna pruriens]